MTDANRAARRPAAPRPARLPRILVAGEFSSGKTQLISGLLGEAVLPSNVISTALPPIWLVSGSSWFLLRRPLLGCLFGPVYLFHSPSLIVSVFSVWWTLDSSLCRWRYPYPPRCVVLVVTFVKLVVVLRCRDPRPLHLSY